MTYKVKQLLITNLNIRSYITSIKCISAKEFVMFSMIIMQSKYILNKWARNNLDGDIAITVSDSGYLNDILVYE